MTEYTRQRVETRIIRDGSYELPSVSSPEDGYALIKDLENEMAEKFVVIYMNTRNQVLALVALFSGGITESVVDVRIIIKTALDIGATTMLIAHNHPSGDPKPSAEDKAVTQKVVTAARMFDISLLDHLVIGYGSFFSFQAQGLL